jgi:thioesterase domain-containing protein/malonyl CoA-acyl carrier protein transacylase
MMDEAVAPFVALLQTLKLNAPKIPYLSNVSGTWITDAEATDPAYYGKHLRGAVRFAQNIEELFKTHRAVLLEVGPGQVLATLARRAPSASGASVFASTRHVNDQRPDQAFLLNTLGQLWMAGVNVDWQAYYQKERRLRVPLPTYPFERQRYWMEEQAFVKATPVAAKAPVVKQNGNGSAAPVATNGNHASQTTPQDILLKVWREVLGIPTITVQDNFFDLGGNSLVAASLLAQIHKDTGIRIPLVKFFQSPNPASLLKLLLVEGWQPHTSDTPAASVTVDVLPKQQHSMIQIIEGNPFRRPFFWTHGTDFANFARVMDTEQPFFCMPPPGLDGKHPIYSEAPDIVNYHISQMKMVQPTGPYIVGGYCLGGHLALNIATELLKRGEEMALVVLVDVLAPDYEKLVKTTRRNYVERTFYHLRHGQFLARVGSKLQEFAYRRKVTMPGNEELRLLQQLDDIQQKAFEFRIPKGYPGKVVSFTCSVYDERKPADSAARWAQLAPNGVDHNVIPGDHATMMREPNIDQLLEILNERLLEASTSEAPTPIMA